MKLVVAWLSVLCLAAITAGSCSIDHKSGDYECTKQSDCSGGRTCTGGYCVLPGGTIDAPKPPTDGPVVDIDAPIDGSMNGCPAQCTTCNTGTHTCRIDCAVTSCNGQVVCPAGWNCDVACSTASTCRNGVVCPQTGACTITCSGQNACKDLECGNGRCNVTCSGQGSCRGDTNCNQSCGCDVACKTGSSCENVSCTAFQCDTGLGCSTTGLPGCNSCM